MAGHGLAASLLACETRALIRAAVASSGSLAGVVAQVNDMLFRDLHNERFVVLFLGALDAANGTLEFVGAGCGLSIYRQAGREFIVTEATMAPLAIFPAVPDGAVTEVTLHPGDVVMLVTDGFYEWEDESRDQFGLERVADVVRLHAEAPAGDLIRCLYQAVSAYAGSVKQEDDLTALVISRAQ